jgi:2-keto-4-pentenoate hydratase/2-oxohepta-3-ene-1,7-dioic acid hydratase in catechol pathway
MDNGSIELTRLGGDDDGPRCDGRRNTSCHMGKTCYMRIARATYQDRLLWGKVDETGANFIPLVGDVFAQTAAPDDESIPVEDLRWRPPIEPSKIVAVGRNYADHAAELSLAVAERPRIFLKPPSGLIGHGDPIVYPRQSDEVHYEAELAVVIGRRCRNVPAHLALGHVFGYTCANDVTARDIQRAEGLPSYAKSFDTFCPLGPWIETELDPSDVRVTCKVNGELRQDASTSSMLTNVPDLIAYVSEAMTLLPGDVLLTGTPAGVGPIRVGDAVTVTIDGIGSLANPVVEAN